MGKQNGTLLQFT